MKTKVKLKALGVLCIVGMLSVFSVMEASANTNDAQYSYSYKDKISENRDRKITNWRHKDYNGSNEPKGLVYVYCATGYDSSVCVLKAKTDTGGSASKPKNYVTAPYYTPTQIRNSIKVKNTPYAALSVRTNSNHGFTGGVWSPDSSKKYNHVVG